jgi:xanthine dehydrogenase small subunit
MVAEPSAEVTFLLNRHWVTAAAELPLIECIRDRAGLTATKPGCHTGDCGACIVAVGQPDPGQPLGRYRAVNSCLMLCAQVAGCHVVTVEGINEEGPHLVQQALVDSGAIQCGYCTPGLVMALIAGITQGLTPAQAAAGNLCRCTGYAAIRAALTQLSQDGAVLPDATLPDGLRRRAMSELATKAAPAVATLPGELPANVIAGATDWTPAHRHRTRAGRAPLLLDRIPHLRMIAPSPDGGLAVGAAATVAQLEGSALVREQWPELPGYLELFASPAIRNMATVGGNLANGSPSADLAVILLALGATLDLRHGPTHRTISLVELHIGYHLIALKPGELIVAVVIPPRPPGAILSFDKVTRRRSDDVASVNLASLGRRESDGRLADLRIATGGVAATPKLLVSPAETLTGHVADPPRFARAVQALADVIAPIDDVHGRAAYRRRLLTHLLAGQLAHIDPSFDIPAALAECRP